MKRRSRYSLSERFTNSFLNSFCTDSPMTSQPKESNQARLMCIQRRITSAVQYWFIDIFCHTMMATFRSVKPFSWANSTKFLNCSDLLTARSMNMATKNRSSSLTSSQNVGYWTSRRNRKFNYEMRMRKYWVVLVSLARCLAVGQFSSPARTCFIEHVFDVKPDITTFALISCCRHCIISRIAYLNFRLCKFIYIRSVKYVQSGYWIVQSAFEFWSIYTCNIFVMLLLYTYAIILNRECMMH